MLPGPDARRVLLLAATAAVVVAAAAGTSAASPSVLASAAAWESHQRQALAESALARAILSQRAATSAAAPDAARLSGGGPMNSVYKIAQQVYTLATEGSPHHMYLMSLLLATGSHEAHSVFHIPQPRCKGRTSTFAHSHARAHARIYASCEPLRPIARRNARVSTTTAHPSEQITASSRGARTPSSGGCLGQLSQGLRTRHWTSTRTIAASR